ncbi:Arm DNA-binding domain-containing protein [Gluconacetobacter asukensis]|uniref:DUF4102 domain-containing protein n=1 Tax=Gluconacetobacter asukensis TaxID=1017181 RepID=A0A7W4NYV5_9PROT|nr:Arm DNA-binding domain-containing protein [Gluconacetobacter asukensis]MBB2170984.1 DUF4102 domain-containing protein [Gluconacetobacter asukensis]
MALTDTSSRTAKGRAADYKLSDGDGLYLLVKPSGARLWNQAYRFSEKQKKLSHGAYPVVSLAEARRLAETKDAGKREAWAKRGAAFFQRRARRTASPSDRDAGGGQTQPGGAESISGNASEA